MLGLRLCRYLVLPLSLACVSTTSLRARIRQESDRSRLASIRVSLRLQDESTYIGPAFVRLMGEAGTEIPGRHLTEGAMVFPGIGPGKYTIEATSPGFAPVHQEVQIKAEVGLVTHFLILKPKALDFTEARPDLLGKDLALNRFWWTPPGIDEVVPPVDSTVECPLEDVLRGAGLRVEQFVTDLEKFTAAERVEHQVIDAAGKRHAPEIRKFEYVASVSKTNRDVFLIDEYRNGSVSPDLFPAQIATQGMPAIVLVFHPRLVGDFDFHCEGLGRRQGKSAWQVHFTQRPGVPGRILGYSLNGKFVSLPLKGRSWIDLETLQVLGIETQLVRPLPEIALSVEDIQIAYEPVKFHAERLWLPKEVELYVERRGRRYYRRHTYQDFRLFTVETAQNIHLAKESYGFTNETDHDVTGVLTVHPVAGSKLKPVSVSITIPAGGSVTKIVGLEKDIAMPVEAVASATFAHDGPENAVKVDAHLSKGSTLEVISGTARAHQ